MKQLSIKEIEDTINYQDGHNKNFHPLSDNDWESYCGACDFYDTKDCPLYGKVTNITVWQEIDCNKFYD